MQNSIYPPPILLSRVCKMGYKIVKKGNIAHVGTSHRGARNGGKCSTRFEDATVRRLYVHIPTPVKKKSRPCENFATPR